MRPKRALMLRVSRGGNTGSDSTQISILAINQSPEP